MAEIKTAFVTGGSGYLGRNLIRHLRERGIAVRALARSTNAIAVVQGFGAEGVKGDLDDEAAMQTGMRGCDVVFHSAAIAQSWGDPAEFHRVNVEGTEKTLWAAKAAGVPRFVHVSTEAVLAGGSPIVNADETVPRATTPVGLYPLTKGQAEERVLAANTEGFATIIVRPRFIWGKDDTTLLPQLVEAVKNGRFQWMDGGRYLTSSSHVDNVCVGLILAAEKGRGGEIYFVTDGEPVEFRGFISQLLQTQGLKPPTRSIPRELAWFLAGMIEKAWRTFRLRGNPPLTRTNVNLIGNEVTVSDAKARTELGYAPVMSREAGLAELRK